MDEGWTGSFLSVAPYAVLQGTSVPREVLPVTGWRAAGPAWRWCVGAVLGLGLVAEVGAQITYTFSFNNPTQTIAENADGRANTLLIMPYTVTASSAPGTIDLELVFAIAYHEAAASDLDEVNLTRNIGGRFVPFEESAGIWAVSGNFAVQVVNDDIAEIDETFVVSVSSEDGDFVLGTNSTTTITIANDDMASIEMLINGNRSSTSITANESPALPGCSLPGIDNWEIKLSSAVAEETTVTAVVPADAPICFRNGTGILTVTTADRIGISEGFGEPRPISKRTGIGYRNDDFALKNTDVTISFMIEGSPVYEAETLRDVRVRLNDDDTATVKFYATSDTSDELTDLNTHSFDHENSRELFSTEFYVALGTPLPVGETVTVDLESTDSLKGVFVIPTGTTARRTLTFTGAIARQALTLRDVLRRDTNTEPYNIDVSVMTTNSASKYDGLTVAPLPARNEIIVRTPPATIDNLSATAGDGEVTLSWGIVSGNGFPIFYHQYQQTTVTGVYADDSWTDIPDSGLGLGQAQTYVVPDLMNGTTYYFRARAVSSAAGGLPSNEVSATPQLPPVIFSARVPTQNYTRGTAIVALRLPVASGGTESHSYTLTSEPPGLAELSFDALSRTLSGMPDSSSDATTTPQGAVTTLSYTATDADLSVAPATQVIRLRVFARPQFEPLLPINTAVNVADGNTFEFVVGTVISILTLPRGTTYARMASQPGRMHALTPSSALPAGLMLEHSSREISGIPTMDGSPVVYTWTVTDMNGATASLSFTLNINPVTITVNDDADGYGVAETEKAGRCS